MMNCHLPFLYFLLFVSLICCILSAAESRNKSKSSDNRFTKSELKVKKVLFPVKEKLHGKRKRLSSLVEPLVNSQNRVTTFNPIITANIREHEYAEEEQLKRDLIIGGKPVVFGTFPAFGVPAGGGCGSVLIYTDILLSASHCKKYFNVNTRVFLGGTQLNGSDAVETVTVERVFEHPGYNTINFHNDIMLVKLKNAATQTTPVVWNKDANAPGNEQNLTAIGHGRTSSEGTASPTLLQVDVPLVSFDMCEDLWRSQSFEGIAENIMICVSYPQAQGACKGDSGGPLFTQDNVLIGLTSFGHSQCSTLTVPNVITRVSAYDEFLNQVICSLSSAPPNGCIPYTKEVPKPCQVELSDANICLRSAPSDCRPCVEQAFMTITGNSKPATCISYKSTMCAAIGPDNPDTCDCDPCREKLQSYYSCILDDASGGGCEPLDCIQPNLCDSLYSEADKCITTDASPTCGPCVQRAITDVFNAGLVSCSSFEAGVCPAIAYECDCNPCREKLEHYYACNLQDVSDGLCNDFDCSLACAAQLDTVNACLKNADLFCPFCIQKEVNALFVDGAAPTCKEFQSGVCAAIGSTCSCEPCLQQLDDYYACVLNDHTNGQCNDFVCCSSKLSAANTCLNQNPGNCANCVQEKAYALFESATSVTCEDFEKGICSAIYSNCEDCGPCQDVVVDYYGCIYSEKTDGRCGDFSCGCLSKLTMANSCLNQNPGDCKTCVENAFSALFANGASPTCTQFENTLCKAITDCACLSCQQELKTYFACTLEEKTSGSCASSFDCSVPCFSELNNANVCLDSRGNDGARCKTCVRSAYDRLFAEGASPNCHHFASTMCTTINTDCGVCNQCTGPLESYYDCILTIKTDGLCSVDCEACDSEPCGLFGLSIFCPFTACGVIGRLLGLCACSGSAFSWLISLFA